MIRSFKKIAAGLLVAVTVATGPAPAIAASGLPPLPVIAADDPDLDPVLIFLYGVMTEICKDVC